MTENEESFKKEIHALLNTAKRDWFVNPKDIWSFFGSLFFCCTVFTTVGKSGGKVTPTEPNATLISLMYFFQGIRLKIIIIIKKKNLQIFLNFSPEC